MENLWPQLTADVDAARALSQAADSQVQVQQKPELDIRSLHARIVFLEESFQESQASIDALHRRSSNAESEIAHLRSTQNSSNERLGATTMDLLDLSQQTGAMAAAARDTATAGARETRQLATELRTESAAALRIARRASQLAGRTAAETELAARELRLESDATRAMAASAADLAELSTDNVVELRVEFQRELARVRAVANVNRDIRASDERPDLASRWRHHLSERPEPEPPRSRPANEANRIT